MEDFKKLLKSKMHTFVQEVFLLTKNFPRDEIYITTSQLKRAALSIILNYTEGYARFTPKNQLNFMRTSYGSLKETEYLIFFALKQNFLTNDDYNNLDNRLKEIGRMLWTEITSLTKSVEE
ncbi:MAG: four helix bundle protein [Candidatus Magasanikbacteria bacterium]